MTATKYIIFNKWTYKNKLSEIMWNFVARQKICLARHTQNHREIMGAFFSPKNEAIYLFNICKGDLFILFIFPS